MSGRAETASFRTCRRRLIQHSTLNIIGCVQRNVIHDVSQLGRAPIVIDKRLSTTRLVTRRTFLAVALEMRQPDARRRETSSLAKTRLV